jgi:hypothetical protein
MREGQEQVPRKAALLRRRLRRTADGLAPPDYDNSSRPNDRRGHAPKRLGMYHN